MEEKIRVLMEDKEFLDKMMACEEPEQVQALFAENGIELSLDEIKTIGKALSAAADNDGELDEDDLEGVAGGVAVSAVIAGVTAAISVGVSIYKNWGAIRRFFRRW